MSNLSSAEALPADGRLARGRQTRVRIISAVLELAEEGETVPTIAKIAAHAGISPRLVHHHFEGIDEIVDRAIEQRLRDIVERQRDLPTGGPQPVRVAALVAARAETLEWITPLRLTILRLEEHSVKLRQSRTDALAIARKQLEACFEAELSTLPPGRRSALLEALDTATSWEAWHHLRFTLEPHRAQSIMIMVVEALLKHEQT
ncbi:TetR/AcrR family transcriptional regulator [Streptomyces sp. NPDC048419]|uniref:TetR/AcrR family transcriptional regulator n=1 Tax=Streptomyces sp. NPDC048419 TaxID=3365547 RepID=UPI003720C008